MRNDRWIWFLMAAAVLFFGAAALTLRAAEQAALPEETATISDDPTVAPDSAQSADNNVSFPTDI